MASPKGLGFNSKFVYLRKAFGSRPFKLLDIGAGNYSASRTLSAFPHCEYYGLDISRDYNNSEEDFAAMKGFHEMDLTQLNFSVLPDNFYDGIWIVHVIEHLHNGDQVIAGLLPKLKPGGYIYVEYPGQKSTRLPSMAETLNFYDDPTHVRIYSVPELRSVLEAHHCRVLRSGTRRNPWFILGMPVRILGRWLRGKRLIGNIFWDLLGFAEFLYARKD
ncbi:MAG TPA: methyltransferase domain-containing protein [Puia sp.]|nr:methyltransferase domain-containing protein [Puia sp.]